jgi:hypothetical protein
LYGRLADKNVLKFKSRGSGAGRGFAERNRGDKMSRKKQMTLTRSESEKLEEAKLKLCIAVRRSMARVQYGSPDYLAGQLGTSRKRVILAQQCATKHITFNQLFRFLVKLTPHFEITIGI